MAAKDAEVAAVRDKVMRQRTVVAQLKEQGYAYPQREADLARLTRDYAVLKTQYDQLLTRRESANISQERGAVNNAATTNSRRSAANSAALRAWSRLRSSSGSW